MKLSRGALSTAGSLYDLIVCLIIYSLFIPALHEAAHWLIARLFGGDGYIQLGFPTSYFYLTRDPSALGFYLMDFAGILVVFFYLLLISREKQLEERLGLFPPIVQQTLYGLAEGYRAITGASWALVEAAKTISLVLYVVCVIIAFTVWITKQITAA